MDVRDTEHEGGDTAHPIPLLLIPVDRLVDHSPQGYAALWSSVQPSLDWSNRQLQSEPRWM